MANSEDLGGQTQVHEEEGTPIPVNALWQA